jgi:hypothetical protein
MDWIKVLNKHVLDEYRDLRDSEFAAWIRIMALTAELEHEPSRKQILRHVNYQTLNSLSSKLHEHSIDLPSIIHKVLMDVSYVVHRKKEWKDNSQQYRERKRLEKLGVIKTSCADKDKEKEKELDNKKKRKNTHYTEEFLAFYKAYPKKKAPDAAWTAWKNRNGTRPPLDIILKAIENQKQSEQWQKESGQFIPYPATWLNQGRWKDEDVTVESSLDLWAKRKLEEGK